VCLDRLDQVLGESPRDLFLSAAFLVLSAKDLFLSAKVLFLSANDLLHLASREPLCPAALPTYLDEETGFRDLGSFGPSDECASTYLDVKLAKRGGTIFGLDADFRSSTAVASAVKGRAS
jgi:hypothetical protein